MKNKPYLNLFWIIDIYNGYPNKDEFFIKSFNLLAGTDKLKQQIIDGDSEEDIYKSWQSGLKQFKQTRKKYLLYPDFEWIIFYKLTSITSVNKTLSSIPS